LVCLSLKTGVKRGVNFQGAAKRYETGTSQSCTAGELATGLTIRYKNDVNGVGLICGTYGGAAAAACAAGQVWRESFEGDTVCVTPDARFRNADGTCRSGYVWRDSFPGDTVCVTPAQRAAAKAAPKKPVRVTGRPKASDGGAVADPPAPKYVTVDKSVDVYGSAGGQGNKIGVLQAGTKMVTLIEKQAPWYNVKWPAGQGWVYSGEGHVSLKLP
jgi:hypothetical protein